MGQEDMIIRCLNCGTKNRIPQKRMQDHPVCGRCGSNLDEMIIRCLSCGKKNRMPENRLSDRPLCGHCGLPLVNMGAQFTPIEISDGIFHREVLAHQGPVLVDCWAPWCGPCRQAAPIFDELASQYAGTVKIAKLNVDDNPVTASKYEIRSIPTILFFKDGHLLNTLVGVRSKEEIARYLNTMIDGQS